MSSSSSPGEGYEKALGLLQQLQNTIETQQKDISRLQSRVKSLRGQNDELRRERDELRESLADKMNKIAELSRKTSSMKGRASLPSLQNSSNSPPVPREPDFRFSGDYAEPIPLVTVEGCQVEEEGALEQGKVTLRRSRSRGDSEIRKGVYLPSTPPIVPRQSRRESKKEREETNTEQEEQEEDQDSSEEEEEEEVSITPVPQHLLDSERFNNSSDMSTDLSSNEGSITSMDDCRSPASSVTASPTHDSINFVFMQTPTDSRGFPQFGSEEEDHPITASMPPMRSRLATVAHVAQRRKKTTDDKVTKSTSLHRQNSFPRRGRKLSENEDSFQLSPDMELKIQQLIQEGLGKKYGGLDRANRAAGVIQKAYRKHKIDLHFKMLRKMQQDQAGGIRERRRTMSVRHRATSILKNKLSATKMTQVRENMSGLSPSISRRELRKKPSPSSSTIAESSSSSSLKADEGEDETPPSIFEGLSSTTLRELFPPGPPRQLSKSALERKKNIGTNIFNRKPVKGIQYLVYHGVLKDDPSDVANYMKDQYGLSKERIGEFVGEIRYDFNMLVLECLVQLIDLSGKSIDEALRSFQLLFRMPGEAQKIDKVMQVFAGEYYHSNKDGGIIKSEDAAYVLSFAIMMLHTDLHNPSVKRHMSKNDWIKMNRGKVKMDGILS
ncbi:PREDICTED: uncharacterized protein LOC105312754 [Amphimedon queenslandica]|uniref:SEC7 domain-containing protein n=1 Tax=Amphimedon queenslandica TaxID=400682 RepID=A0A1X7UVX4_AMPQE|nr:PREDICTED: uncharacterized protein LOC105312754 [Amphimedon queenslandica]|eukprot:XP_011403942.1 PREDICTED: uncharacterized protein LOC105312754 [Amphimedon queenslandica]